MPHRESFVARFKKANQSLSPGYAACSSHCRQATTFHMEWHTYTYNVGVPLHVESSSLPAMR